MARSVLDMLDRASTSAEVDPPISIEVAGQRLTLFFTIESQLELMLRDIKSAKHRVWLVTHDDWRNQPWWQRLLDRLAWSLRRWL